MPGPNRFEEVITPSTFFTEIVAQKNRNEVLQEEFVWNGATEVLTFKSPRSNDANAAILDFRRHSFFVNGKGYAKFWMSQHRTKHGGDNDIALAHWIADELQILFCSA
ncbi:MAG: hypothetical protein K0R12_689, partial [Gammaproteobacteria bacterium]|nr:hypothetical protein [Gammaproteobacteria bacterium]